MSTVSRVKSSQILYLLRSYVFSPQGDLSQALYVGSHIQSLGEGNGTALQYSCLENPMDGGARWATVHGVAKSWTRLRDFTFFSLSFCFSFSILIPFYYQIYYMHTQTIFTFHHLSRNTPFILVSLTPWDQSLIHHIKLTCLV